MRTSVLSILALCLLLGTARAAVFKQNILSLEEGTITELTFNASSILTICNKDKDLTEATDLQLVYNLISTIKDPTTEVNVIGVVNAGDNKCVDFDVGPNDFNALLEDQHEFELYAYTDSSTVAFHGRALLTIPDKRVNYIQVYGNVSSPLYRASGTYTGCLDSNINDACYSDDVTTFSNGGIVCSDAPNELTTGINQETVVICQPTQARPGDNIVNTGSEIISFLKYPSKSSVPSSPALAVTNNNTSESVEMVLLDIDGVTPVKAYSCNDSLVCNLDVEDFTASNNLLTAVVINVDDQNDAILSSQDDIQDINIHWFFDDPYVEFGLANVASSKEYTVGLYQDNGISLAVASLDCTNIDSDGVCLGFLNPQDKESGYLSVTPNDDTTNIINVPFSKADDVLPQSPEQIEPRNVQYEDR